jgi:hypothetical protein
MLRVENVAIPATAATDLVPKSVALLGFVPSAMAIVPVYAVSRFSNASSAVTWTAGVMTAPELVVAGWTVKASFVAAPGRMVNAVLVPLVSPAALAASV